MDELQPSLPGIAASTKPNGSTELSKAEFRAMATSILIERMQFMRQHGLTFNGARDEYEIFGYDRVITNRQYREEYQRGGIAGRIVDAFPNATWRGKFELVEDEDAYDPKKFTELEKTWNILEVKHQIHAKFLRVDKLAGLSTFAALLIGAPGDLETELPKGKPDDLLYLQPFSGGGMPGLTHRHRSEANVDADCSVHEFETDPENERFGLPKSYTLKRTDFTSPLYGRPVHWSRILHVAENLLDDDVAGLPVLERVWNLLADLRKVTGGGAEAFWLRANQGLNLDIDKDMAAPDAKFAIEVLKEQQEAYKNQMDRWLRTKGTKVNVLGSDVANFEGPVDTILTQIAGAKAIPKRILTGSEMGELASSQDRDNWKDQVNGRQTGYAAPCIVRPFIDRLIKYGYLPAPKADPTSYVIRWPHIETLTAQEKAEGAKGWASVNQTMGDVVFTKEEIRDRWEGMAPLTEEQLQKIADENAEKLKQQQEMMAAQTPPDKKEDEKKNFPRAAEARKFASTEVRLPRIFAQRLLNIGLRISDEDLAEDGREGTPHVTVKYGLHDDDPSGVQRALSSVAGPVKIAFGKTKFFAAEDYDVVYVEVLSPDLKALNERISSSVEVTDTHPTYVPHATVAYVKSGLGAKYAGNDAMDGMSTEIPAVVFSPTEGEIEIIDLSLRAAEQSDEELVQLLADAIECGADDVVAEIVGLERQDRD